MNTKSILYHLLLSYSLKELIGGNIYHCKIDYKAIKKSSDSILTSFKKSATPRQMDDIKRLLDMIEETIIPDIEEKTLLIPYNEGNLINEIHDKYSNVATEYQENGISITLKLTQDDIRKYNEYILI